MKRGVARSMAFFGWLALVQFGGWGLAAEQTTSLSVEELLARVTERARAEREKPPRHEFTRVKTTLEYDRKHRVVSRKERTYRMVIHGGKLEPRLLARDGRSVSAEAAAQWSERAKRHHKGEDHDEGNTVLVKLEEDYAKLFDYQISGSEPLNGRPVHIVTFRPKREFRPRKMEERVMARIVGRIWIDAEEYEVAKLEVELTQPVKIALGLLGSVEELRLQVVRNRLPDGEWMNSAVKAWLQFRVLLDTKRFDYQEVVSDLQAVAAR